MALKLTQKLFLTESSYLKLQYLRQLKADRKRRENAKKNSKNSVQKPVTVRKYPDALQRTYPVQNSFTDSTETDTRMKSALQNPNSQEQEMNELQKTFGILSPLAEANESNELQQPLSMEIPSLSSEVLGKFQETIKELRQDPQKFEQYFKMSVSTFDYMLRMVYPKIQPKSTNWCSYPVSAEERLGVTLRFLGMGTSMRQLAIGYGYGHSTVRMLLANTLLALWECLQPVHMKRPTTETFLQISKDLNEKLKFPHALGVLRGKHVRVKWSSYSSKSIVLQAAVDANNRFIFIDVWNKAEQVNAGTFRSSELCKLIKDELLDIPADTELPSSSTVAPFVFIGDRTYPLLVHLLKPYREKRCDEEKAYFNTHLKNARKVTDIAFAMLASRWQILTKPIETTPIFAEKIVKCICVLHNTIIDLEGPGSYNNDAQKYLIDTDTDVSNNMSSAAAQTIRDCFKTYLYSNREQKCVLQNVSQ